MIRINDAHAIKLVAGRAGIDLGAKIHCIAHYDNNDILTGGGILMNDNGYSIEVHMAGFTPSWGNRELLWAMFNYIFKVRKIKKLFGRIAEGNYKSRELAIHLGFKEEVIIEDVFRGGEGLVVVSMYEEDCRFVNRKPPKVKFAPIEKTDTIIAHEFSQLTIGS